MPQQLVSACLGDIVKLKEPYLGLYGFGIVVEITDYTKPRYGKLVRNVSLHLYNEEGKLYIEPSYLKQGLMLPHYVDFHVSELVLYKRPTDAGYNPSSNPPNWDDPIYLK